ncbi:MAG: class I SAM-dependent methyltransferase [Acidobacteriia bacterium]|nr:class I SAM-dependent methyltransferase [Terriglobia bacterium]
MNAYRNDLSYIHDVGFGGFANRAAKGLLKLLRQAGITKGVVVDLGCGSGIWAQKLSGAGYEVWGIDLSPAMIRLARKRVPSVKFLTGSYLKVALPPCDAVTALGECFNYRFDKRNNLRELSRLFRRVYRALRPGGLFLFDMAGPGRGNVPHLRYWEGNGWAILVDVVEDQRKRQLTRQIMTFRKRGKLYRRDHETHSLHLFERTEITKQLRQAGFSVHLLHGYGKLPLPKSCTGFMARKP